MTTIDKLSHVRAKDIMKRNVFKLDPTSPLEEAVLAFSEMHISGAPVVDRGGRLVGVLSAYDIAKPENMREGRLGSSEEIAMGDASVDDDGSYDEDVVFSMDDYNPGVLRKGTVADFMTPEVISVAPDATLKHLCALMVREHIHRVLVVEHGKLVGIISSLDVARCIAEVL